MLIVTDVLLLIILPAEVTEVQLYGKKVILSIQYLLTVLQLVAEVPFIVMVEIFQQPV